MSFITSADRERALAESGIAEAVSIYEGDYYQSRAIRSVVFLGTHEDAPVALKLWRDPRGSDEPLHMVRCENALSANHPQFLVPHVRAYRMWDATAGWMLTDRIDTTHSLYTEPASREDKQRIVQLWRAFHTIFSPPDEPESAHEIARAFADRNERWFTLARAAGHTNQTLLEQCQQLAQDLQPALRALSPVWEHNHFFSNQLFVQPDGRIAVLDFAHARWVPAGYGIAMIIWHFFVKNGSSLNPASVDDHLQEWFEAAAQVGVNREMLRPSLLDRYIGAICADIGARAWDEKMRAHLLQCWKEIYTVITL